MHVLFTNTIIFIYISLHSSWSLHFILHCCKIYFQTSTHTYKIYFHQLNRLSSCRTPRLSLRKHIILVFIHLQSYFLLGSRKVLAITSWANCRGWNTEIIYLYTNTLLDGSVTLSVTLSVRYRNHFPVVQFQNQAHI